VAAVCVLVAAGISLLCALLHDAGAMLESGYGRLVLCKIASVALLLLLAAMNRLHLTPRLRAGDAAALRLFGGSVIAEMVLVSIVLSVTAAMTTLTGPGAD
jgi:putative copper export protein